MKIDDPKTPYCEDQSDDDSQLQARELAAEPEDPIVMGRLKEAKVNREKNAHMLEQT